MPSIFDLSATVHAFFTESAYDEIAFTSSLVSHRVVATVGNLFLVVCECIVMSCIRSKPVNSVIISALLAALAASVLTAAAAFAQHFYVLDAAGRIPSAESMLFGWRALAAQHQDDAPTAEEYLIEQLVN
jgi:hypothetical protein